MADLREPFSIRSTRGWNRGGSRGLDWGAGRVEGVWRLYQKGETMWDFIENSGPNPLIP
jgi:hypothetical protein